MAAHPPPPPFLDLGKTRCDGLAFLGLSLSRAFESQRCNTLSATRQTVYDFNAIQDRDYRHVASTNDDGWLCGGGESKESVKLSNPDSAHIEVMRIGNFSPDLGGLSVDEITSALRDGSVLIPVIQVLPTGIVRNSDQPPELEVRFDLEVDESQACHRWANWQLRFIHNQLFHRFRFPARFCPGPFHMTYARKVTFRSEDHGKQYYDECAAVLSTWRDVGPQILVPAIDSLNAVGKELTKPGGLYLFKDRTVIIDYFAPNFLPPYDSIEKQRIIMSVLSEQWDEQSLSFFPTGFTSPIFAGIACDVDCDSGVPCVQL